MVSELSRRWLTTGRLTGNTDQGRKDDSMSDAQGAQPEFQIRVIPVTSLQQNASLIWSTATMECALVDPGGEIDQLMAAADELKVKIVAVWLTHGHIDHVGAATAVKERTGCPIIGPHKADQWLLDEVETQSVQYGIAEGKNVCPDRFLEEGDTVELSGLEFRVLHCPGHSPGHIVLYHQAAQFAFVGDVLFRGSIGRTDLPRGDHAQLIRSVTDKLWPLGEQIRFIPGHGPSSTFGQERLDNAFVADHVLGRPG